MALALGADCSGVGLPGRAQVGIGEDAGQARGEVRKDKDGKRDEIDFAVLEIEGLLKCTMLGKEEAVRSNSCFGDAGAAAGEGDQRGFFIRDIGERRRGIGGVPRGGAGELAAGTDRARDPAQARDGEPE